MTSVTGQDSLQGLMAWLGIYPRSSPSKNTLRPSCSPWSLTSRFLLPSYNGHAREVRAARRQAGETPPGAARARAGAQGLAADAACAAPRAFARW